MVLAIFGVDPLAIFKIVIKSVQIFGDVTDRPFLFVSALGVF
jgi:hypothetical protein